MSRRAYNRQIGGASAQQDAPAGQPQMLGSVITEYLNQNVAPKHASWKVLQGLWNELVPESIAGHCELTGFEQGRLTVTVDSPGYAHELRLMSGFITEQLKRQLPKLKITKITTTLG